MLRILIADDHEVARRGIRSVLESHPHELRNTTVPIDRLAVLLHDSLTGDVLYRLLAGIGKQPKDAELKRMAEGKGFLLVAASPLTRSSYHAGEDFERLRAARHARLA